MASSFNYLNGLVDDELLKNSQIGYFSPEDSNNLLSAHRSNALSFLHINIRSLNANYVKLIELLSSYEVKLDLIILSEIWNTNINYFSTYFSGYTFLHAAPSFQLAGGTGILVRNSLSYNIIDSSNESNYFNTLAEYIAIDVIKNRVKFRVYLFYRYPKS